MIRAGFIGTGGIVGAHLRYLKGRDDVEVAAMCDVKREAAEKRSGEFGGVVFTDFNEMLDKEKLDAVWLCTPPQVRREPLLACARKRIPVFCEKPVERDAKAGAEIAEELGKLDAKVQVGYCFRSVPAVARLREAIGEDPVHLVQSFYGCDVSLTRGLPGWFYDKAISGGALVDQATHNLDLLRYLLGEVEEVHAMARNPVAAKEPGYTIDETIAVLLAFRDGPLVAHLHTWVGGGWRNEIVFSGEKRYYRLDPGGQSLRIEGGGEDETFGGGGQALHVPQNERFLEMVESGDWSRNPCDYADGLKTLELTLACDEAITRGKVEL